MDFHLRRMSVEDAQALHQLMVKIYPTAYAYLWEDGGRWYLEQLYNPAQLRQELADKQNWFGMVEGKSGDKLGWIKVISGKNADSLPGKGLYLQRIYLAPSAQGKGLGRYLCDQVAAMGQAEGCTYLWLESMDSGPALGFYEKLGFSIFDQQRLTYPGMVDAYRTLLSMQKKIG